MSATQRPLKLALLSLAIGATSMAACNKHVFEVVPRDCTQEQQVIRPAEVEVPADILVVVDNSGSMCEEQQNLVENFYNSNIGTGPGECPIDGNNVQPEYRNPTPDIVERDLSDCGFVQLLAAYENDWRLGVITTDVGECDNRYQFAETQPTLSCDGNAEPGWGRRPQRGCLQPYNRNDRANSIVLDRSVDNVGAKFADILGGIKTWGSPFERGLDAMQVFLNPNADRAPGCEGDLDAFLREDAKLVVIFLTDEDDCSHADGQFGLPDENDGESCDRDAEEFYSIKNPEAVTDRCYTNVDHDNDSSTPDLPGGADELAPVSRYADFLRAVKGDPDKVSVAVIAGATKNDDGTVNVEGCQTLNGLPAGNCNASFGSSNATGSGQKCDPNGPLAPCCKADKGTRYFSLAQDFEIKSKEDSICFASFRNTMLEIAAFIARTDFVALNEPPASPGAIIVQITRADQTEPETIPRIPDGEDPSDQNGWQWDGGLTINFYGNTAPQPGDKVFVATTTERDTEGDYVCGVGGSADGGS
jgi:hypothetical protein